MEQNKGQIGAAVCALPSDLTEREQLDLLCQVETYMSVTDKHSQTHSDAEAEEERIYSLVNSLIAKRFSDIGAAVRGEAVAEELKLLHRGGHSPSTSGNGIAKSWMDELDQSREYMRSHGEKSSTSGAPAAANELVDSSKPPAGLVQREQMIWMMVRNSKESSVSVRAADAPSEPSELRQALIDVRHAIQFSYDSVGGIDQMPVMMHHDGTVVEFIDGVLKSRAADALDSQPTELLKELDNLESLCMIAPETSPEFKQLCVKVRAFLRDEQPAAALPTSVERLMAQMDQLRDEYASVSGALAFWLPNVPEEDGPIKDKVLGHVFYLGEHGPDKSAQDLGWITVNSSSQPTDGGVPK